MLLEELIDGAKPPDRHARPAALPALDAVPLSAAPPRVALRHTHERGDLVWIRDRVARRSPKSRTTGSSSSRERARISDVVTTQLTAFTARARTARGVDLVAQPFDATAIRSRRRSRYAATQALGDCDARRPASSSSGIRRREIARAASTSACSRRRCSARPSPRELETWHCIADAGARRVREARLLQARGASLFRASSFLVAGALPSRALKSGGRSEPSEGPRSGEAQRRVNTMSFRLRLR